MMPTRSTTSGLTMIELLLTIGLLVVLATIVLVGTGAAREKTKITVATVAATTMRDAVRRYAVQMSFYPPDVERGCDPGFMQPLPANPSGLCNIASIICTWCPVDWQTRAQNLWDGPYLSHWPLTTPWGGTYDYQYWLTPTARYGCTVPSGVYIGIQRYYGDTGGTIPSSAEQYLLDKGIDADGCLNGEAQVLIKRL